MVESGTQQPTPTPGLADDHDDQRVQKIGRSVTAAKVMTATLVPVTGPLKLGPAPLAIETLLYAINDPPQAALTVLTASRTSVELRVEDGVDKEDV